MFERDELEKALLGEPIEPMFEEDEKGEKDELEKALLGEPIEPMFEKDELDKSLAGKEIVVPKSVDVTQPIEPLADLTEGLDIQQAIKPPEEEEDISLRFNAPEYYEPEVDFQGNLTGQYIDIRTGEIASKTRMNMTNLYEDIEDPDMEAQSSEVKYGAFGLDKKYINIATNNKVETMSAEQNVETAMRLYKMEGWNNFSSFKDGSYKQFIGLSDTDLMKKGADSEVLNLIDEKFKSHEVGQAKAIYMAESGGNYRALIYKQDRSLMTLPQKIAYDITHNVPMELIFSSNEYDQLKLDYPDQMSKISASEAKYIKAEEDGQSDFALAKIKNQIKSELLILNSKKKIDPHQRQNLLQIQLDNHGKTVDNNNTKYEKAIEKHNQLVKKGQALIDGAETQEEIDKIYEEQLELFEISELEIQFMYQGHKEFYDEYKANYDTLIGEFGAPETVEEIQEASILPVPNQGFLAGLKEGLIDEASVKDIPFIGIAGEVITLKKTLGAYNRIKDGLGSDEDKQILNDFYAEAERLTQKKKSKGFRVGSIVRESATFMGELVPVFLAEWFTATVAPAGEAYALKKVAEKGIVKLLSKALKDKSTRQIVKKHFSTQLKQRGKTLLKQLAVTAPLRATAGAYERMVGTIDIEFGEVLEEGQPLPSAILNAFTAHATEVATELGGGVSGKVLKGLASPARKYIAKVAMVKALKKKLPQLADTQLMKMLNKVGWNGIVGEWFEERDADILHKALYELGLGDQDFQGLTLEDITDELLAFGIMGGAISTVIGVTEGRVTKSRISTEKQLVKLRKFEKEIALEEIVPTVEEFVEAEKKILKPKVVAEETEAVRKARERKEKLEAEVEAEEKIKEEVEPKIPPVVEPVAEIVPKPVEKIEKPAEKLTNRTKLVNELEELQEKIKTATIMSTDELMVHSIRIEQIEAELKTTEKPKEAPIKPTVVPKRKPVLESLKVLQDKTSPPKRVEAAKAFLKEKGIGFSIPEIIHEVKKEEVHIKVENSIKALSEKQKEISQIKNVTTQEKAKALKEYNQKATEAKKELTQLMSKDVSIKSDLKKQAFIFNNLKSLVETTKESIEIQDISKEEKSEYNKALDGLLKILEEESGFILVGMIPKLSTFIKGKKKGDTLTKKEIDLLNKKLKRDYTFLDEKFESEYQTDKIKDAHTLWGSITNNFEAAWQKITREFEHLPKGKDFGEVGFILRMMQKQKGIASYKANKNISTIIDNLKRGDFNLFSRKILLDDLVESANRGEPLPRNWDFEMVKEELNRLDNQIKDNEKVQGALDNRKEYWNILKKDYVNAMKLIGKNIKGMDRKNYFRHLVLDYADVENYLGIYSKLKTPVGQSFLKKRIGSVRPIRTDYVMAEYDVIVRMIHDISVANIINEIKNRADIKNEIQEKTPEDEEWKKNIPNGYSVWQPEQGNFFFFANTIPDNIATGLLEGILNEAEITKDQIRKVLAIGGKKQEMVLRNEVIETLNNLNPPKSKNWISNSLRWVTRKWKIWTLISPRRYIKYNLRNLTGDAEAAFVGNFISFKKVPQAIKELFAAFVGKKTMTDQLRDYFEMGGFEATLQSQEIKPVDELKPFITINKNIFKKVWNGYWKAAKGSTDFRESILRYANYLSYLEQYEQGKLKNYGASMKVEVDALSSNKKKAYMLANDLLGAYDRVGVAGQSLRELLFPFWSWQEVNFKRYIRFVQNAADSDQIVSAIGRKLGAKTFFTSLKVGKYVIKATSLWIMLTLWNNLMFPDEEEELSEQEKNTPHIIFGRDKNGDIISFNRLGTLGDFVEWVGLDAAPANVAAYLKNRKTIKEISIEMLQSPVNKFVQGVSPLLKAPPEFMDRKSWFPDVFNRYTIRDRGIHLARSLGLENEYKAVVGKPSKKYAETLKNLAIYTTNPGQVAYSKNYTMKNKFLKKTKMTGYFMTDKSDAIYNYKAAIRYKDAKAAARYYLDYYILMKIANPELNDKKFDRLLGKDIAKALAKMHPLSGLSKKKGIDLLYIAQLNSEEKLILMKAIKYYDEILTRSADIRFEIEIDREMVKLFKKKKLRSNR